MEQLCNLNQMDLVYVMHLCQLWTLQHLYGMEWNGD